MKIGTATLDRIADNAECVFVIGTCVGALIYQLRDPNSIIYGTQLIVGIESCEFMYHEIKETISKYFSRN